MSSSVGIPQQGCERVQEHLGDLHRNEMAEMQGFCTAALRTAERSDAQTEKIFRKVKEKAARRPLRGEADEDERGLDVSDCRARRKLTCVTVA
jgi:uncharacterized membrane protein